MYMVCAGDTSAHGDTFFFPTFFIVHACTTLHVTVLQGQWTDGAIDALLDYIDCDNTYLQVCLYGLWFGGTYRIA